MPRDGSGIYSQPFPNVVAGTEIESAVYNGFTNDVAIDLNAARPLVAGGTGANNAREARAGLEAEVAAQEVTNYDSHVWETGSFYSVDSATAAPTTGSMSGHCVILNEDINYITLEARSNSTGKEYVRQKQAGVWGTWSEQASNAADLDTLFVNTSGDTMTGGLGLTGTNPQILFNKTGGGGGTVNQILGQTAGLTRWNIRPGNETAESGSAIGSDFTITSYDNAGVSLGTRLTIGRADGRIIGSGAAPATANDLTNKTYVDDAAANRVSKGGDTMSGDLTIAKNNPLLALNMPGGGQTAGVAGLLAGAYRWAVVLGDSTIESGNAGSNFTVQRYGASGLLGTALNIARDTGNATFEGNILCTGLRERAGTAGAYGGSNINFDWGGPLDAWVDNTKVGTVAFTSDYRTKKDVIDLPGMWDTVKGLRPVKYTQAQFSPPSHVEYVAGLEAEEGTVVPGHLFEADDIERWGFIAHELQETLLPSAASSVKDSPDTIQTPNPWTVIAALTSALQEAIERIEALEAR